MSSALQKRKKELRSELAQIEKQIYDLETSYLEETKDFGNIFTGWDAYLSSDKTKQRKNIQTEDRLFSLSSVSSPASKRGESKKSKAVGSSAPGAESGRKRRKLAKDDSGSGGTKEKEEK